MSGNSWPFFMLHVTPVCRQQGKVKLKGGCCLARKLEVRSPTPAMSVSKKATNSMLVFQHYCVAQSYHALILPARGALHHKNKKSTNSSNSCEIARACNLFCYDKIP